MHLAAGLWIGDKDMRIDKSVTIEIKTLEYLNIIKLLISMEP